MFLVQIRIVKIMVKLETKMYWVMVLIQTKKRVLFKNIFVKPALKLSSNANTILYDLRTDKEIVFLALKMILKGMNLRSVAKILEIKLDTVRRWLQISAKHCEEVNKVSMKEIDVEKVELNELWTHVKKKHIQA
jgi:hypothetical protein